MHREIITTEDGSKTLFLPELNEHYHSKHGAIQESQHVFIAQGLWACKKKTVKVLEIGFGTGLNGLLTLLSAEKKSQKTFYRTLEPYPLEEKEYADLNYAKELGIDKKVFLSLHQASWERPVEISPMFSLHKTALRLEEFNSNTQFDLVYFDPFSSTIQPELWKDEVIEKVCRLLAKDGIFVTYSAKGSVRRALQRGNLTVERLPGPPKKREMLRGINI